MGYEFGGKGDGSVMRDIGTFAGNKLKQVPEAFWMIFLSFPLWDVVGWLREEEGWDISKMEKNRNASGTHDSHLEQWKEY